MTHNTIYYRLPPAELPTAHTTLLFQSLVRYSTRFTALYTRLDLLCEHPTSECTTTLAHPLGHIPLAHPRHTPDTRRIHSDRSNYEYLYRKVQRSLPTSIVQYHVSLDAARS
jgi:hypothetical protein